MNIQTDQKVKLEVYRGPTLVCSSEGKDFDMGSLPCDDITHYQIVPIQRFQVKDDQSNDELAHIKDNNKHKYIAQYITKKQAYKLTEILNKLNNQ